jgi:hypothetical protein
MPEDYFRFQQTALAEPEQLWIKKPKNLSRGRGIDMVRHPATVPLEKEWIIQRYLSNPHLCQDRKYVLRCYVLITSVEPLRFYWYKDGFAKLASESYSKDDLDNLYRHLTNPDINENNAEAESAVTFISLQKYRQWLDSEGHSSEEFFHQLKELISLTIIATREAMRKRLNRLNTEPTSCYELIGLDCMVDENIKPWIVECNLSPSLSTYADPNAGANDEVMAKRNMVQDLVQLLGLNNPSHSHYSKEEKAAQERDNCGDFECLFPTKNANDYFPLFPIPRYQDIISNHPMTAIDSSRLQLTPHSKSDYAFSDSITIFATKDASQNTQCILPNEIATWIWLKISEGESPEDIIVELSDTLPCPENTPNNEFLRHISQQVWNVLADWSHANVFSQIAEKTLTKNIETPIKSYIPVGNHDVTLNIFCENAESYLQHFYRKTTKKITHAITIDIIPTPYGYTLIYNKINIVHGRKLSQLLPTIYRLSIEYLAKLDSAYFLPGCLLKSEKKNILIIGHTSSLLDSLSDQLAQEKQFTAVSNGFLLSKNNTLTALNLPISIPVKKEKNNALVVETKNKTFKYFHMTYSSTEKPRVDTVVFLSDLDKKEKNYTSSNNTPNHQQITKADLLKKIWENTHDHNSEKINFLALWIESIEECFHIEGNEINTSYRELFEKTINKYE